MKSGRGAITMEGSSTDYQGIGFVAPVSESDVGAKQLSLVSAKTSGTAIQLTGSSSSGVGVGFNYQNPKEVLSLGGGQVTITGTGAGMIGGTGLGTHGVVMQNLDLLSTAGSLNVYGGTGGVSLGDRGVRFGSDAAGAVTSSTASLTVRGMIWSTMIWPLVFPIAWRARVVW